MFRLNIILALAWIALIGDFSLQSFIEGFVIVFVMLVITQQVQEDTSYLTRVRNFAAFIATFFWAMAKANVRVAITVLSPRLTIRPAVVAIPLDLETDVAITLLANMITLTPGTLTLDVSADRKVLYVHTFDMENIETFREEIKSGFERRVREVTS